MHRDDLKRALRQICEENSHTALGGEFQQFSADVHWFALFPGTASQKQVHLFTRLRQPLDFINRDFDNILTLLLKIEWYRNLYESGQLNIDWWSRYTQTDIDWFHLEFRSIFDYVTLVIGVSHDLVKQIPESYDKFRNRWLSKSSNQSLLDD